MKVKRIGFDVNVCTLVGWCLLCVCWLDCWCASCATGTLRCEREFWCVRVDWDQELLLILGSE